MPSTSDLYEVYERQVRIALFPLGMAVARARILDVLGWYELRQHYTRKELVEHGLVARSVSYRHEGHFEELVGKTVDQTSRQELDAWIKALTTVRPAEPEQ